MNIDNERVLLSATDLVNHLACSHLTALDLQYARGDVQAPEWTNPSTEVLRELGLEHESSYLNHLREQGLSVVQLERGDGDYAVAAERAVEAMKSGSDVIYQPALRLGHWVGRADVLLRVDRASKLGGWSYEAVDCKLARDTRAGTILQLALYSESIAQIQGVSPEFMHVVTPGNDFQPTPYRTTDYAAYYRSVKSKLNITS